MTPNAMIVENTLVLNWVLLLEFKKSINVLLYETHTHTFTTIRTPYFITEIIRQEQKKPFARGKETHFDFNKNKIFEVGL